MKDGRALESAAERAPESEEQSFNLRKIGPRKVAAMEAPKPTRFSCRRAVRI
jgi:hypothetical protein